MTNISNKQGFVPFSERTDLSPGLVDMNHRLEDAGFWL